MTKHGQEVQVGIQKLWHKHTEVGGDDVEMGLCPVVNKCYRYFFLLKYLPLFFIYWKAKLFKPPLLEDVLKVS